MQEIKTTFMKTTLLTLLAVCTVLSASAQNKKESNTDNGTATGQNVFYAELGGPGILFSANYDRRFTSSHLGFGGRVGLGFVSGYIVPGNNGTYDEPASVVTVPVQLNYIFGKRNSPHTFEVGAGVTVTGKKIEVFDFYDDKMSNVFGTASFMYRRQPVNGGFVWRIGFTPIIAKGYIQAFGGVAVGYSF
jgi:hypothetical protein